MRVSTATGLTVALDREGQGSYCAFALQPDGGRVRCGPSWADMGSGGPS